MSIQKERVGLKARKSGLAIPIACMLIILGGCEGEGPPPQVRITLSPTNASVHVTRSIQFSATVSQTTNTAVTWTVSGVGCSGASCGTISGNGLFTAPAIVPSSEMVMIRATSVADSTRSAYVWVTILPAVVLIVTPPDPTVAIGSDLQFTANIQNALDGRVNWTVSGPGCEGYGCGTISTTGRYTAPSSVPAMPTVIITATSVEDPATSASATALIVFSALTIEWGWMAGPQYVDAWGVYGTIGLPSPTVSPGARQGSAAWSDPAGGLWLFGGRGLAQNAIEGFLNDLWRYEPSTGQWTWWSGSNTTDHYGVYGTRGIADPANVPGGRYESGWCQDASANFWLFGGYGILTDTGGWASANDLWKFDPATRQWTWVSGSKFGDQAGVYGTKGVADPANVPGAKTRAISWIDLEGNLWLFGGSGPGWFHFNDLWKFDVGTRQWTWVSGSDSASQPGVYRTKGVADPANMPGGRALAVSFRDPGGRLWLFGGAGHDSSGENTFLNDLWMFDPATVDWTWVSGSPLGNQAGVYGTKGETDPSNIPGSRFYGVSWVDQLGNFWLFGGYGNNNSPYALRFLSDLWQGLR